MFINKKDYKLIINYLRIVIGMPCLYIFWIYTAKCHLFEDFLLPIPFFAGLKKQPGPFKSPFDLRKGILP